MLVLIIGAAALIAGPLIGFIVVSTTPNEAWFAKVNGTEIPRSVLVDVLRASQIDAALQRQPFDPGAQAFATAARLVDDEVLRQTTEELAIEVSEADIRRELAAQLAPHLDPSNLDEVAEAQLAELKRQYVDLRRLSISQLEMLAEGEVLRRRAAEALGRGLPDPQPQIRLHSLVLPDATTAARAESDALQGVPFEELARRYSLEPASGDLGWLPYDALPPAAAELIWNLPLLEFSPPFQREDMAVVIYVVSAQDPSRSLDIVARQLLEERAFASWLRTTRDEQQIELQLDSETLAWVIEQLAQTPDLQPS